MKNFIFISSLGFIMITPILICTYLSIYLRDMFNLGNLVVIIGLLFGVFCGAYSLFRAVMKKR